MCIYICIHACLMLNTYNGERQKDTRELEKESTQRVKMTTFNYLQETAGLA